MYKSTAPAPDLTKLKRNTRNEETEPISYLVVQLLSIKRILFVANREKLTVRRAAEKEKAQPQQHPKCFSKIGCWTEEIEGKKTSPPQSKGSLLEYVEHSRLCVYTTPHSLNSPHQLLRHQLHQLQLHR